MWFFTPSNPTITFGGFEGEGKKEMYEQLPASLVPKTIYIDHTLSNESLIKYVADNGFQYPFIVKPDVGMKGILFRKISSEEQLLRYHERIPVEYIIQDLIELPVEVSVFYYRHPTEAKGTISGFIQKELLQVVGNGIKTLKALIEEHPRAKFRMEEMQGRHGHRLNRILDKDEIFYLSYAGNHNRGARFINLHYEINDEMTEVFDAISHTTTFYYGRYDIKTSSIDDLKQGKNFQIIEFNGCGAEPNHIYDCEMSLISAYREILKHWKVLYRISKHNHENGISYWSYKKGRDFLKAARRHFALLEKFD